MISKAVAKYLRISPRKTRTVIELIKGKGALEAMGILNNTNKKAATLLAKVLNSAIANAKRIPNIELDELYIIDVRADGGPSLKRYQARAMGRADVIKKPTSHVTIALDLKKTKKKVVAAESPKATPKKKAKSKQESKTKATKTIKKSTTAKSAKKSVEKGVKSGS